MRISPLLPTVPAKVQLVTSVATVPAALLLTIRTGAAYWLRLFVLFVEPQLVKVLFSTVTVILPACLWAMFTGAQLFANLQFLIVILPSAVV